MDIIYILKYIFIYSQPTVTYLTSPHFHPYFKYTSEIILLYQ